MREARRRTWYIFVYLWTNFSIRVHFRCSPELRRSPYTRTILTQRCTINIKEHCFSSAHTNKHTTRLFYNSCEREWHWIIRFSSPPPSVPSNYCSIFNVNSYPHIHSVFSAILSASLGTNVAFCCSCRRRRRCRRAYYAISVVRLLLNERDFSLCRLQIV